MSNKIICPHCKKECKEGQAMWNGKFVGEEIHHWDCRPDSVDKPMTGTQKMKAVNKNTIDNLKFMSKK